MVKIQEENSQVGNVIDGIQKQNLSLWATIILFLSWYSCRKVVNSFWNLTKALDLLKQKKKTKEICTQAFLHAVSWGQDPQGSYIQSLGVHGPQLQTSKRQPKRILAKIINLLKYQSLASPCLELVPLLPNELAEIPAHRTLFPTYKDC